jgi:outer membrane protein
MKRILLIFCLAGAAVAADSSGAKTPEVKSYMGTGLFSGFLRRYLPEYRPAVDFSNSQRLDALMRAGHIYLSLRDAIALALENNLDIEFHRYSDRRQAETDVLRASAGQLLRFNSSSVRAGFSSASSGALGAANAVGNVGSSSGGGSGGQSGILSGFTIQAAGSGVPNLDPVLFVSGQSAHASRALTTSFTTGTNALVSSARGLTWGVQKGFLTGTNVTFDVNQQTLLQNSPISEINPSLSGNANLSIRQPLLQGFGWATNARFITIAKNNVTISDLNFQQQVIATVKNITDLYWDLVAFNDNLRIKQQALALAQKLYEDNKKRAAAGAIAPIDIIQAEAGVATAQLDLSAVEAQVLQQEMILKSAITRSGVDSLAVIDARIVPTDSIQVPNTDAVEPLQDMIGQAMENRPELKETDISLENSRLTMLGVKNAMRPGLDVFVNLTNNALAGQINTVPIPGTNLIPSHNNVSGFFVGGAGTFFSQILGRNFPDYSIGFNLNVPLRNSGTRADMIKAQLDMRQAQITEKQQQNSIRLGVVNARIALQQARAGYDTAVKARMLQEQTFAGEQRKYQLGTSSFLNVVLIQRDVVNSQSAEVNALRNYISAKNNMDLVLGRTLEVNRVDIEEAYTGVVKRPPDALPVLDTQGAAKKPLPPKSGVATYLLK